MYVSTRHSPMGMLASSVRREMPRSFRKKMAPSTKNAVKKRKAFRVSGGSSVRHRSSRK